MPSRTLATIGCVVLLAACSTEPIPGGGSPDGSRPSAGGPCRAAPAWLVERLEAALTPPGATLQRIFVVRAGTVSGDQRAATFADPGGVGALINGAGVRPAPATWLIDGLRQSAEVTILGADVNARRYSSAAAASDAIGGQGMARVLACVGPAPVP
jgi:hypothetical protein